MNFAPALHRDLAEQAKKYAQAEGLPYCLSYGDAPVVCVAPYDQGSRHGNFVQGSHKAIQANPAWRRRLAKVHTQGRRSLSPVLIADVGWSLMPVQVPTPC